MVYEWKKGWHPSADVNKVKCELDRIGENLTADDVVEFAESNKKSELHSCFEWNNKKAGHLYRLSQARDIIRAIVIIPDPQEAEEVTGTVSEKSPPETIPAYTHIIDEDGTKSYKPSTLVVAKEDELKQVLGQISESIAALERKARAYSYLKSTVLDVVGDSLKQTRIIIENHFNEVAST